MIYNTGWGNLVPQKLNYTPAIAAKAAKIQSKMALQYPMTNLLEINVYGCKNISRQGIADLKKALPRVKDISSFDPNP